MTTNMKRILDILAKDERFQQEQDRLSKLTPEEAYEWLRARAAQEGIELSDEDLKLPEELKPEELEASSGGIVEHRHDHEVGCVCNDMGWGYECDGRRVCLCQFSGSGYFYDDTRPLNCAYVGVRGWGSDF